MKKLVLISFVFITLLACSDTSKIVKVSATGKVNSVLVVLDNDKWQNETGDVVRDLLAKTLVGFPQEEARFSLTQIDSKNFNRMLKHSRNIISISFTDKNTYKVLNDKYASPQRLIVITAKNNADLVTLLNKHEKDIVKTFNDSDLNTIRTLILDKVWERDSIKTLKKQKISIKLPYAYQKVQDTLNYIWFRKDIVEGYLNLQVYTVKLDSLTAFNKSNIIKFRDEKGKQFIPGEKEGMYLATEAAFTPTQYNTMMLGRKTIETRGTWEMKKGFMAGPFLNYALLDKKNNRIVVAEGFVYAPNISKRDYLFELEALLKTLEIE